MFITKYNFIAFVSDEMEKKMSNQIDYQKIEKKAIQKEKIINTTIYGMLGIWALVVLFPFYWMLLTSLFFRSPSMVLGQLMT